MSDRVAEPVEASETWSLIDDDCPIACHVMAARFDDSWGEWIVGVVQSPPTTPFTHWRNLPPMPDAAIAALQPDGEVVRTGRALLAKLDVILPVIQNLIVTQTARGYPYSGPDLKNELDDFRAALRSPPVDYCGYVEAVDEEGR